MNKAERKEINTATETDENMDTLFTEEQVEAIQAEEFHVDKLAEEVKRQEEEAEAEAILDKANLAVQEYRNTNEPVDITSDKLSDIEQQLSDSIILSSPISPGAFNPKSKTMGNTDQNTCRKNVRDVVMFGDDLFKLMSRTITYAHADYETDEILFWKSILQEYITYLPDTGNFIWHTPVNKKFTIGDKVGSKTTLGYINIKFKGRQIHAHRLAFIAMENYLPKLVDHKDRNKSNTIWSNLRQADYSLNSFNTDVRENNSSGTVGVHYDNRHEKWVATIGVKNKSIWLGYFDEYDDAVYARLQAEKEHINVIQRIPTFIHETKAMDTGKGCVIQVTTQQLNIDGTYSVAEALTYVTGVTLVDQKDDDGDIIGRRLKGVR